MTLILETSIRAGLIALAIAAVIYALRIASAPARHIAWCTVLAAMLLLPALSTWAPKATLPVLPARPAAAAFEASEPELLPIAAAPAAAIPPSQPSRPSWQPDPLLTLYLAVTTFFLFRLLLGTARAASLLRIATPEPGFRASSECACPVTVGWLRPSIILPAAWNSWPHAELDAVLVHEREHVRRRDPLVQWIAALNRCVFWFHPLAWWLEHSLAALAEEACDSAVIARGHDPRDYSEYLLHQARAIQRAGTRLAFAGTAMGGGELSHRIRRLLDAHPTPALSRTRIAIASALSAVAIVAFTGCQLGRVEKAAPGQPTMNELMHRRADKNKEQMDKSAALLERAKAMSADEASRLFEQFKQNPTDPDTYWTLVWHYEHKVNVQGLDALRLYLIEHEPNGKLWTGNIDPRIDRAGYERGKALWLAHLKQPGAPIEIYRRAADFLEGGDKPLAETILEQGRKAYPDDKGWAMAFGRHYAQVLQGSAEPLTAANVFRARDDREAQTAYAQSVRARLLQSNDAPVLAQTAQWLVAWADYRHPENAAPYVELAHKLADRALSIQPDSKLANSLKERFDSQALGMRVSQLTRMSPAEQANLGPNDRMLLGLHQMRTAWAKSKQDEAVAKARELLDLAAHNQKEPQYADVIYEANILLGKAALRGGDKTAATRYLLASAETPGPVRTYFEMNLARALVDWGQRSTVADYLDRMAPKVDSPERSKDLKDWAAQIRKGINPDLLPTFSYKDCTKGPC